LLCIETTITFVSIKANSKTKPPCSTAFKTVLSSCPVEKTGTPTVNIQLLQSSTHQSTLVTDSSSLVLDAPTKMEGLVDEFLNMCANEKIKCDRQAPGIINSSNSTNDITMYREDEPYLDMFQLDAPALLAPFPPTPQNVFTVDDEFQKITETEIKQIIPLENKAFKQPISVRKNSTLRLDVGLQQVQSTSYDDILNTPEVVKTLTEQESTFNLLAYVFDEKKNK